MKMNKLEDYNSIKDFYENTYQGKCLCQDFNEKSYYFYFNIYWKQNAGEENWKLEIDTCAEEIGLDVSGLSDYNEKWIWL